MSQPRGEEAATASPKTTTASSSDHHHHHHPPHHRRRGGGGGGRGGGGGSSTTPSTPTVAESSRGGAGRGRSNQNDSAHPKNPTNNNNNNNNHNGRSSGGGGGTSGRNNSSGGRGGGRHHSSFSARGGGGKSPTNGNTTTNPNSGGRGSSGRGGRGGRGRGGGRGRASGRGGRGGGGRGDPVEESSTPKEESNSTVAATSHGEPSNASESNGQQKQQFQGNANASSRSNEPHHTNQPKETPETAQSHATSKNPPRPTTSNSDPSTNGRTTRGGGGNSKHFNNTSNPRTHDKKPRNSHPHPQPQDNKTEESATTSTTTSTSLTSHNASAAEDASHAPVSRAPSSSYHGRGRGRGRSSARGGGRGGRGTTSSGRGGRGRGRGRNSSSSRKPKSYNGNTLHNPESHPDEIHEEEEEHPDNGGEGEKEQLETVPDVLEENTEENERRNHSELRPAPNETEMGDSVVGVETNPETGPPQPSQPLSAGENHVREHEEDQPDHFEQNQSHTIQQETDRQNEQSGTNHESEFHDANEQPIQTENASHNTTTLGQGPTEPMSNASPSTPFNSLPTAAPGKHGKFLILSRGSGTKGPVLTGTTNNLPAHDQDGENGNANHKNGNAPSKKKPARSKKQKKKNVSDKDGDNTARPSEEDGDVPATTPSLDVPRSTGAALDALPAQEVSITASTAVKMRTEPMDASKVNHNKGLANKTMSKSQEKPTKKSTKSKKKKKGLSNDAEANRRAVQQFNRAVQLCVMQSDPDAMRDILHDPRNHNFALDGSVLETVMKAYVMAAMFEDALYCLRHCTLPGTLDSAQTEHILSCLPQNLRNSSAYTAADMINALCIATAFDSPTSRTYFLRIVRGISLEFLEEATSARDRICSSPCERLVRAGLCVVNAHLKRGKKPADLLVDPGDQLGVFVPDTMENRGIQAGDAVSILPYAGPYPMSAESLDRNMIEATVTNTNPMVLRLQDKANASLYAMLTEPLDGNVYRIDKLANRMGFNRQLAAAVAIASPIGDPLMRDPRRPSPELIRAITAMDENIDLVMRASQGGKLPKGELTSTAALCSQAIPWNAEDESENMDQDAIRSECRLALEKYGALDRLNGSQMLAVEGATSNRLTLVQGPPGTGKTLAATRILQHWARLTAAAAAKGETPPPILATSDSNIAVDNLVEGCAGVGLRVIRLGRPEAIRPELLRYCIDRPPSSYSNDGHSNGHNSGPTPAGHRERLKQIRTDIKNAQVICCTCIGSGGDILDGMTFDRVLVDEATQATEPAVLVPLMRGCRQLVLVGDHCQLPPTVLSTRAEEEGHGVPLFSRMVACGVPPFMLDTQYRMHPRIAMFPSDLFYGGLLKNGVSAPERRPLAGFPWPVEEFPVAFIPVKGVEMDDGVSKYNEDEALAACNAVAMLMSGGQCRVSDIAVVTPYAAQAKLIRRMTRRLQENTGPPYIEVSSVDGFQGREKEAVVFSAVRSNDYGAIGFTSDWRRVNVSFTRARRGLIVIGNDATLRRGDPETWGPWLAWADAYGLNVDKPGVPRGRYDPEQLRRVRGGTTAAEMLKDVLERQHAQLKSAEKQQERAEKNALGQIRATSEGDGQEGSGDDKALTLEEDIAQMENADGHWDDSDEEDESERQGTNHNNDDENNDMDKMSNNTKTTGLASGEMNGLDNGSNAVVDVWDL